MAYSLAIIVWLNNFQAPKIQAVLSSFFCDGNDIVGGSNRGGGWGILYLAMQALRPTAELFGVYGQYHTTIFVLNMQIFLQYLGFIPMILSSSTCGNFSELWIAIIHNYSI